MKNPYFPQIKFYLLIILISLSSGICTSEEDEINPEIPVASEIEMQFPKSELTVGETLIIEAFVKDNNGNVMSNQALTWSSSNPEVIDIDSSGLAEAKSPGTSIIEVTNRTGIKATHEFTVMESEEENLTQEPHSFDISPTQINIEVGQSVQIEMVVFDIVGVEIENPEILFKSMDEQICIVNVEGLVEGLRPGSTKIHIEVSNKFSEIPVTVSSEELVISKIEISPQNISAERGEQVQFSAKAYDQFDQEIPDISFDWSSSNACIVSIEETGLAAAYTPGNARITATVGDISGRSTISVLKSETLEADTFDGKWSICLEENGDQFGVVELEFESTNNITRMYTGNVTLNDGSSFVVRGNESISGRSIAINWSEFIQVSERTSSITSGTFIDQFAIKARLLDGRTLIVSDVRLSRIEE